VFLIKPRESGAFLFQEQRTLHGLKLNGNLVLGMTARQFISVWGKD
jgi:hypothetical protein